MIVCRSHILDGWLAGLQCEEESNSEMGLLWVAVYCEYVVFRNFWGGFGGKGWSDIVVLHIMRLLVTFSSRSIHSPSCSIC